MTDSGEPRPTATPVGAWNPPETADAEPDPAGGPTPASADPGSPTAEAVTVSTESIDEVQPTADMPSAATSEPVTAADGLAAAGEVVPDPAAPHAELHADDVAAPDDESAAPPDEAPLETASVPPDRDLLETAAAAPVETPSVVDEPIASASTAPPTEILGADEPVSAPPPDSVAADEPVQAPPPGSVASDEPVQAPPPGSVAAHQSTAASPAAPRPPVPSPAMVARALRRSSATEPAAPEPADVALAARAREWGRVDEAGEVFVKTADGERSVGSWPVGQPDAALAFYARKYETFVVELDLLEQRILSGTIPLDEAAGVLRRELGQVGSAQAVGDLEALAARLRALRSTVDEQRQARRAERARVLEEARQRKVELVTQAEGIGAGSDWRGGVDAMKQLLDAWKALPRLDRATDDELWHRFSAARTNFTRRRKAHFSEQSERRDEAKSRKEALATEAEQLSTSTDWGSTATRFRELMADWKAAGLAWRADEEALWERFRTAQEAFFSARTATFDKRNSAETDAAAAKEALLREAQGLLPVRDLAAAKSSLRSIQERWLAAGRVPRAAITRLEGGLRAVEEAVKAAESAEWQRTSPEALARAESTVIALQESIAKLEKRHAKAVAAGNDKDAAEATAALQTRRGWLASAEETLADFRR